MGAVGDPHKPLGLIETLGAVLLEDAPHLVQPHAEPGMVPNHVKGDLPDGQPARVPRIARATMVAASWPRECCSSPAYTGCGRMASTAATARAPAIVPSKAPAASADATTSSPRAGESAHGPNPRGPREREIEAGNDHAEGTGGTDPSQPSPSDRETPGGRDRCHQHQVAAQEHRIAERAAASSARQGHG